MSISKVEIANRAVIEWLLDSDPSIRWQTMRDLTNASFPNWWHYDVLRGLEFLRRAGVAPDERVAEAIALVESKRDGDGKWPLEYQHPGTMPVEVNEGVDQPSRWTTLRALRVLDWYVTQRKDTR